MKPHVVLVGTGHKLQAGSASCPLGHREAFKALIDGICHEHEVRSLAEEMSEDALIDDYGVTATIGKQVADSRHLKHLYVDLKVAERQLLNIDRLSLHRTIMATKVTFAQAAVIELLVGELRECLWLVRVLSLNEWPCLFLCEIGRAHV